MEIKSNNRTSSYSSHNFRNYILSELMEKGEFTVYYTGKKRMA